MTNLTERDRERLRGHENAIVLLDAALSYVPKSWPYKAELRGAVDKLVRADRPSGEGEGQFGVALSQLSLAVYGLKQIARRPVVERNPDGDDQAAHSMKLIAEETLAALASDDTPEEEPEYQGSERCPTCNSDYDSERAEFMCDCLPFDDTALREIGRRCPFCGGTREKPAPMMACFHPFHRPDTPASPNQAGGE